MSVVALKSVVRPLAVLATLAAGAVGVAGPSPADGLAAGAAGSRSGAPTAAADTTVVNMTNGLKFTPAEITIEAGETVTWKNGSVLVHTVTAVPDSAADRSHVRLPEGAEPFGSGRLAPKASYSHTFETPGTYRYICIPHEAAGMVGTVRVEDDGG